MSIALARAHPHLRACILDYEFVCVAAPFTSKWSHGRGQYVSP
jgi:hypothetical protein